MTITRSGATLRRLSAPPNLLKLLVLAILVVLVGLPLWQLVWGSFHTGAPFNPGAPTLANYRAIFSDPLMPTLVSNTLIFAATS